MPDDEILDDIDPPAALDDLPDGLVQDLGGGLVDDLPDGRESDSLLEQMDEYDDLPRDDRILDKVSPEDYIGEWDPKVDDELHRFIALREAGFRVEIDITEDHGVWFELTERVECRSLGYQQHLGPGTYFDGPDHEFEQIVSLHRTKDWERLKELSDFDTAEWPMDSLVALVEEVVETHA